jgi:serine 3-dehydrogenase
MILITGASSGIGAACARAFAQEKRGLVLVARRLERLEELKREIQARWAVEVEVFALDVGDREAVERFARERAELLGRVTTLVNNAGLAKGMGSIDRGDPADWDEMIDTNIKGLLYLTRAILPRLRERGDGHVINLGSVAGHWVYPNGNVYCATKHAVRALTEGLRMDLNGTGVRVTEISPGMVETEFSQVRLGDAERAKAVYAGMIPLTPEDIAESIVWCANRPARVNIQELVIYPTDQASPTLVTRRP